MNLRVGSSVSLFQSTLRKFIRASTASLFTICLLLFFTFKRLDLGSRLYFPDKTPAKSLVDNSSYPPSSDLPVNNCLVDLDVLNSYGLDGDVEYARIDISVAQSEDVEGFSTDFDIPFPSFIPINLSTERHQETLSQKCSSSVKIRVPSLPNRANASHILFGVATTPERLNGSLDAFAHWAGGTGTHVIAVIEPHPDTLKKYMKQRASSLGFSLTIVVSAGEYLDRYFSLIQHLFNGREMTTEWVGIIDDDTFFPSMSNLVSRLSVYDANKPQYIGAITEDTAQMLSWGYMAYGGAGIFLSMPLLQELNDAYDICSFVKETGDRRIAKCIYHHTTTKLTWEHGLHQVDLHGDASGFFESARPLPLSVHHWKSWFHIDMVSLIAVASVCGDDCLLRRWRFSDDWFLVNGYSLVKYSTSPEDDDITMEKTWERSIYDDVDSFMHALGPLRPKDESKISFRLQGAIKEAGCIRQFYVHKSGFGYSDQVVEIVWWPV